MKITLVYPGIATTGFSSLGRGGMDSCWISLGLCYLGSYLKKTGHSVELIDLREMAGWKQVKAEFAKKKSEVYGIYFNTVNVGYGLKCAKIAKSVGGLVVAGGPHATISPEKLLATGVVDFVICGEGELSFVELLHKIANNYLKTGLPKKQRIIRGKPVENLDSIPFPDRNLFNMKKVLSPINAFPFMDQGLSIMASRGCPFNCAFCQPLVRTMFGSKVRYRSVSNVIAEIKEVIKKYNVRYISFQDDTFTARRDWVLDLCKQMKKQHIHIQWSAQSRVNTFDYELAREMKAAGCVCIFFGFESGSQRVLNFMRKGIKVEQSLKAAEICRQTGLLIFADYMLGVPTETKEELLETYSLISKIKPEIHSPTYFTPVPGSDLYHYCHERGLINIKSYKDFARNPIGKKIKEVDYNLLNVYKLKMTRQRKKWFQESYYAKMVLSRWFYLLKLGHFSHVIEEFVRETIFSSSILAMLKHELKLFFDRRIR